MFFSVTTEEWEADTGRVYPKQTTTKVYIDCKT